MMWNECTALDDCSFAVPVDQNGSEAERRDERLKTGRRCLDNNSSNFDKVRFSNLF